VPVLKMPQLPDYIFAREFGPDQVLRSDSRRRVVI
jgi:hypothetical protein